MSQSAESEQLTFWQHLEVLRGNIIHSLIAFMLCSVVAFCFRDLLFQIIIAPSKPEFVLFRLLNRILGIHAGISLELINTALAGQFLVHMRMALVAGLLLSAPYLLFELMRFVSPALYSSERRVSYRVVGASYLMFMVGVAVGYFLIFPLTALFLGTYQVSATVDNMITIESYVDMMLVLLLMLGVMFQMPVISYLLARLHLLDYKWLTQYRKHAIVAVICLSAVITPSGDAFTLLITALPLYLLFELSVVVVKRTNKKYPKNS